MAAHLLVHDFERKSPNSLDFYFINFYILLEIVIFFCDY
jgi:hypothetical protein